MRFFTGLFLAAVCLTTAGASDLIDVTPVTNQILLLHFDDGMVKHHGYHQSTDNEVTNNNPLKTALADQPAGYLVKSVDDADFTSGVKPVDVGRKSKPMDVSEKCKWTGSQCDNDFIYEHWVYLVLPQALKRGKTYTVDVSAVAENVKTATFTFDVLTLRSETVHVNQIGYRPAAMKIGYLSQWMGDLGPLALDDFKDATFHLVDAVTGSSVFQGKIEKRKDLETGGPDSEGGSVTQNGPFGSFVGADVWQCNFSSFSTPGEYRLAVEGIGCSYPFEIKDNIYREPYTLVTRAVYHQRSGIPLEPQYTEFTRPRTQHYDDGFVLHYSTWRPMDGGENNADIVNNATGEIVKFWGWYQDAGDWDAYPRHVKVPAALCAIYELHPEKYTDGELNIPESGNGIPDILDEAGWLVYFWKRSKGPNGGVIGRTEFSGDLQRGISSWEDPTTWYACGEEPQTNFYYAAVAAQYAFCLRLAADFSSNPAIADSAESLIDDAKTAYQWALDHLRSGDAGKTADDRAWAAAALYKATGEGRYQDDFKTLNKVKSANHPLSTPGIYGYSGDWDQEWAVWTFITSPKHTNLDVALQNTLIQATILWGERRGIYTCDKRSIPHSGERSMPVVVGQMTTPRVFELIYAYEFSKNVKFLDYIQMTCDYFLGGNQLNTVFVTGLGDNHVKELLDLDSWYRNKDEMVEGIVPYGATVFNDDQWVTPHDFDFNRAKSYPNISKWPIHEQWYENRCTPISNEFTVDQFVFAAAAYGYLVDTPIGYVKNQRPTAQITTPAEGESMTDISSITIEAAASDVDGYIRKVEFYQKYHKIGEATHAPYTFTWKTPVRGTYDLIIHAIDNKGKVGKDTVQVKVRSVISGVNDRSGRMPTEFALHPNVPNPFNPSTTLRYDVPVDSNVKVEVFDLTGRKIRTLIDGRQSPGVHSLVWAGNSDSAAPVSSGVYFCRMSAVSANGDFTAGRKVVLVR